ncbi:ABC1 kinase family protein [Thermodesulfitimonas autotrophica]|uniref:ABC1 kinase family protein n=1 Tax=Thermodesulfitimonas autotrophica TaxID=1894989 RepID=UPI002FE00B36
MHFYLRKRYKHFSRYRGIANVLVRHGFSYLVYELGLSEFLDSRRRRKTAPEAAQVKERLSPPVRLRFVLEELGPTFIKLGQILSTRGDLLPPDYIAELEKLQDQVPPFPFAAVRETIRTELGLPLEEIFATFETTPVAAASIGQVHRATLRDGTPVVVKVQRPGIEKILTTDLEILRDVARFLDRHGPWRELYSLEEMVAEFEKILREEVDFTVEGRHAETFRRHFSHDPTVYFPAVYWDWTTRKVLVMEEVAGVKLTNPDELARQGIDRQLVARRLADALLKQIFLYGFFHGDPHPGNLAALPDNRVLFMDFGIVGVIDEELQEKIGDLVLGLVRRSTSQVMRAVESLGAVPPHVDRSALRRDIDGLRQKYYEIPLSQISLAESMRDILSVAFKHQIRIPTQLSLLIKSLVTAEGVIARLDPELSIVELARPLARRLAARRLRPPALRRMVLAYLEEYHRLLTRLPDRVDRILELAAGGELKIKAVNPDTDRVMRRLNAMINRLVFAILLASLIIGSAFLLSSGHHTLWGLPLAKAGFVVGIALSAALVFSILRSRPF